MSESHVRWPSPFVGDIDLRRLDLASRHTDHQPDPVGVVPTLLAASAVREADRAALMPLFWVKDHPFG